jgi:uncharacterized protein
MPLAERTSPASTQLNPTERIDAIDVLRGMALFGVMAINVAMEFRVSIFQQFLPAATPAPALDRAVQTFLTSAIELKAFALFSWLFGVGLAIQFERLADNPDRAVLLLRRLAILLVFGLAHLFLIWNGDILTEYSLAGFAVLPLLWGPRWLLATGAALALALYLVMPLLSIVPWPTTAWMRDHVVEASRIYGSGGFGDILAFRIREVASILPLHLAIFPRTIALFLFGMWAWRTGILRRAATHGLLLVTVATLGIVVGGALTVLGDERSLLPFPGQARLCLEQLAPVVLAAGYGAAILGLMTTAAGKRMLGWAAPLGRMAFTNYLVQSIIFGWIFYGYGFGLFDRVGVAMALAIGIGVYVAQVLTSAWWLKHHRFGPLEWLWRSAMYGSWQRLASRLSA